MGKKITIDSATLMNKVFEVIEAKNIFNIPYSKIKVLIHPKSYVHALVQFKNGITKLLIHDTSMKIPIFNSLYDKRYKSISTKPIDIRILNNLNLDYVDIKKFSFVKILKNMPKYSSLFETILITINDYFVHKFLNKDISFEKMIFLINKFVNSKRFQKYKKIKPKNVKDIYRLRDYVSSKMNSLGI
jgi:1-deoxy-D-xylulose-5-phosphate reductoisomerase